MKFAEILVEKYIYKSEISESVLISPAVKTRLLTGRNRSKFIAEKPRTCVALRLPNQLPLLACVFSLLHQRRELSDSVGTLLVVMVHGVVAIFSNPIGFSVRFCLSAIPILHQDSSPPLR